MISKPSRHYPKAVGYFIVSLLVSVSNDTISKFLILEGLPASEITFFRMSFGMLYLLTYGLYSRQLFSKPLFLPRQAMRGVLFVLGSTCWTYGLIQAPISIATLVSFSIPIWILLLSPIFLPEKPTIKTWILSMVGLGGVFIVLYPTFTKSISYSYTLALLGAALFFALLDIINKKYVNQESLFTTIFYPNCIALLFILPSCYWSSWLFPTSLQWSLLAFLGLGGNAIIYLLLKAYQLANITSLTPLRYSELIFSGVTGYCVFGDLPGFYQLLGAVIIIPSVSLVIYQQNRNSQS